MTSAFKLSTKKEIPQFRCTAFGMEKLTGYVFRVAKL